MPTRPLRPCLYPHCSTLVSHGRCAQHRRLSHEPGVHYGRRWGKMRQRFLADHPFCVRCAEQNTRQLATEADHIIPHDGRASLMWDVTNLQPLCKSCHSRKTLSEVR
jgi:5-methylcytosine-specific restriction enzyme A